MRQMKYLVAAVLLLAINAAANAQHNHGGGGGSPAGMDMSNHSSMSVPPRTENLKVWGKCEQCKARIEKIALASGVESADWNIKTKSLQVTYSPGRTNLEYISEKLAKAGHDTGIMSAKDKAYNALPECCKYERIR